MTTELDRILDLLIARALGQLDDGKADELELRLASVDAGTRERLEAQVDTVLTATGNASALAQGGAGEPPPDALLARLEADADRFFGTGAGTVTDLGEARAQRRSKPTAERPEPEQGARPPFVRGLTAWSGWAAAAVLALVVWVGRPAPEPPILPPSPTEARATLLSEPGTDTLAWSPSTWADFEQVRGDVSWNDARQEGYLRLVGMPANDPDSAQYQLWIVDPERDERPVDGGVFDIPPGAEEVIVPIRATLAVDRPAAFAITREKPGGVVVSEGPLLVVASRG
jgi:hypothetical protein